MMLWWLAGLGVFSIVQDKILNQPIGMRGNSSSRLGFWSGGVVTGGWVGGGVVAAGRLLPEFPELPLGRLGTVVGGTVSGSVVSWVAAVVSGSVSVGCVEARVAAEAVSASVTGSDAASVSALPGRTAGLGA